MGKHLNAAVKDMLVTMSEKMTTGGISRVTNVPEWTLQRLFANPYKHNEVHAETRGRHRVVDRVATMELAIVGGVTLAT